MSANNKKTEARGAAGGRARAAKLSRVERQTIARQAAEARWAAERRKRLASRPKRRIALADFLALPTENPMTGKCWRKLDNDGRWLLIEPADDFPMIGRKTIPIIVVPVRWRNINGGEIRCPSMV